MENSANPRSALLERIREGIRRSERESSALKKKNSRYITVGIAASALSTVIAGATAALGPLIGQGPPAWKFTCGAVAVCTGIATVFTGLQKQLSLAERLAKATSSSGKLRSLEFALTISNRETTDIAREYETIIASYSDVVL
jgi:hypothetical protein